MLVADTESMFTTGLLQAAKLLVALATAIALAKAGCHTVLVARNATVTILLQTPAMTLTAQGRATEDGARGETVRVIEVTGLVAPDDARFGADPTLSRVTILGGYADPVEGGTR